MNLLVERVFGNKMVLSPVNTGSVLVKGRSVCLGKQVVGRIVETIGRVESPLYVASCVVESSNFVGKKLCVK